MAKLYHLLGRALRMAGHPTGPLPGVIADYHLARSLGMLVVDVRRMPVWEFAGWIALNVVEAEAAARAQAARR